MSYATITQSTRDQALVDRIIAAVSQEAFATPQGDTPYGERVKANPSSAAYEMVWPVCIAGEDAYASALADGNPNPGGDESVITDPMILSAVQANWPA